MTLQKSEVKADKCKTNTKSVIKLALRRSSKNNKIIIIILIIINSLARLPTLEVYDR
jgi:hypothetical protein